MATSAYSERLSPLRTPAYFFLIATIVFQVADFIVGVAPLRATQLVWRFATIGSLANNVGNVLLLVFLLEVTALVYRDRLPLLAIGIFTAVGAVFLLICASAFTLDVIQLRGSVQPEVVTRFMFTSGEALTKCVVEAVLFAWIAASAHRAWRRSKPSELDGSSDDLLISRGSATR